MSRALPKYRKRRIAMIGGTAAVVLSGAVITGSALAGQTSKTNDDSQSTTKSAVPPTVSCPDVASRLRAVPAAARAEVDRNLALLATQIQEANNRLATSAGQGGADLVQNAVLNPLKDKRVATINRIVKAAGRSAQKQQVDALATCTLNNGGNAGNAGANNEGANCNNGAAQGNGGANAGGAGKGNGGGNGQAGNAGGAGKGAGGMHGNAGAQGNVGANAGGAGKGNGGGAAQGNGGANAVGGDCGDNGGAANNGNNGGGAANDNGGNAGAANTVSCPDVASRLRAVPAAARAEVDRNLALLATQIQEANNRLATSAGQGGADLVQNAVLNPLKDKRVATINRIVKAAGRSAQKQQVDALATCTLNR
ncbi:hypothetical protein PYK79_01305 [Streptomyces sp. ID05-04B]|uniref:hypothetical protein n=1 Tax=Streptomyces sp. ID05-04B TaxID=3028661 RepID=UPI0029C5C16A|nr:hypothetical protein [Streptomyces sp. ID05-04B]MDX5562679.1 hypothetical protein [Streptomyces sp. ID05-04B]